MIKNNWSAPGLGKNVSPELVSDEFLNAEIVILLHGTNLFGNPVYAYVKLLGSALREMFAKMRTGENFKPSDYGSVIAAGTGSPPENVRDEMKAEYNMVDVPLPKKVSSFANLQPKFFDDE